MLGLVPEAVIPFSLDMLPLDSEGWREPGVEVPGMESNVKVDLVVCSVLCELSEWVSSGSVFPGAMLVRERERTKFRRKEGMMARKQRTIQAKLIFVGLCVLRIERVWSENSAGTLTRASKPRIVCWDRG